MFLLGHPVFAGVMLKLCALILVFIYVFVFPEWYYLLVSIFLLISLLYLPSSVIKFPCRYYFHLFPITSKLCPICSLSFTTIFDFFYIHMSSMIHKNKFRFFLLMVPYSTIQNEFMNFFIFLEFAQSR